MPQAPPRDFIYQPPNAPYFSVLHLDEHLIVLDKQSGLLTVPGKPEHHKDCLEYRVQYAFDNARIVHRLDMETSGICLMARGSTTQRHVSMQFQKRQVEKSYIAHIWGHLPDGEGEIDLPLICDWPNRPKQMVDHDRGKASLTKWTVLEEKANTSIVRLFPHTGRSHQLRVHMMAMGCPILGDNFYAHDEAWGVADRLQLHAEMLEIYHPQDGKRKRFCSPCPF